MKTKLQNIRSTPRAEFEDPEDYDAMIAAHDAGEDVTVTGVDVEVDGGESDYYSVTLQNGRVIDALSGYHLKDIVSFSKPAA